MIDDFDEYYLFRSKSNAINTYLTVRFSIICCLSMTGFDCPSFVKVSTSLEYRVLYTSTDKIDCHRYHTEAK